MRQHSSGRVAAIVVVVVALLATAGFAGPGSAPALASFQTRGSVGQVSVTGLVPGSSVELLDPAGEVSAVRSADAQGAVLFRSVEPAAGYRVRSGSVTGAAVAVMSPHDHPAPSFYEAITVRRGYGYLPTRDGTTLSVNVHFPLDDSPGPWPVLVNYSGYDPSAPGDPPAESRAFLYQGYVVVGVNMRGTGCSGGAYDYFEPLQGLDGYDVVETLARQSWSNGDVGLVGLSYPGISQLFVAATRPPHLRAITPLSVIADTYRSSLYPGGIRNEGFSLSWAEQRVEAARPAARGWARDRIARGDTTCAANQALRLQARDLLAEIRPERFYDAAGDELAPRTFVDEIDVPVYLSGAFQDEQTGGHWSTMVPEFDPDIPVRVTLTNGTHVEPLGPDQLASLLEFVDLYVGKRVPRVAPFVRLGAPAVYQQLFGSTGLMLPLDRFAGFPDHAAALAAYEAEPPVRVLWENGAGRNPGDPVAAAQTRHDAWPVPGTVARSWYLDADGRLHDAAPSTPADQPRAVSEYLYDPTTKAEGTFAGNTEEIWARDAALDWRPLAHGTARSFVTEPFASDSAFAGWGSVDLWLRSGAPDTDIEVTLTEVRPDGKERYIQSGWLRASHRHLDPVESTPLMPFHTHLEADATPLPPGEASLVRVALFPFAHVARAGTRLRLNVEAPGGNQPFWNFTTLPGGDVVNEIVHAQGFASKVVLPVLPTDQAPTLPPQPAPCPSLRNQPCRPYLPEPRPLGVTADDDGSGALVVSWSPPEQASGVTGYRVEIEPLHGRQPAGVHDVSQAGGTASTAVFDVGPETTSLRFAEAVLGVPYVATVTARFGDDLGLPSSPSLAATVGEPRPPTPEPDPSPTTTTQPVPAETAQGPGAAANPEALPRTGASLLPLLLAAALLAAGTLTAAPARGLRRRR